MIEIEVGDDELLWYPEPHAQLAVDVSGSRMVRAGVDLVRSTTSRLIPAGLVIRLVLRLDAPLAADPSMLTIDTAGDTLTVALGS